MARSSGRYIAANGDTLSFLLSKDRFTTINVPGSLFIQATGINDQGEIVGLHQDANGFHGFVLAEESFTSFDAPREPWFRYFLGDQRSEPDRGGL
jgi:hypothetical protein